MKSEKRKKTANLHSIYGSSKRNLLLPFGRIGTKLLIAGLTLNRMIWENHKTKDQDPYWRIYLPVRGEILLHFSGEKYRVIPGNLYLIPPEENFRIEGIRPFSHYWCHFLCPSLNFTEELSRPVSIPDPDGKCRTLMHRMVKLMLHAETLQELLEMQTIPLLLTAMILDAQELSIQDLQQGKVAFSEIIQYIEKNLSYPIRIKKLAMLSGQSLAIFTADFRKAMGVPPKQYISMQRINRAKQLLLSTDDPVKQISQDVGIPTSRLFYRLFRKYALSTPEGFRKYYRMKDAERIPENR